MKFLINFSTEVESVTSVGVNFNTYKTIFDLIVLAQSHIDSIFNYGQDNDQGCHKVG